MHLVDISRLDVSVNGFGHHPVYLMFVTIDSEIFHNYDGVDTMFFVDYRQKLLFYKKSRSFSEQL